MITLARLPHTILFSSYFFFFNDTATTEIYTLSLHDPLPIFDQRARIQFAADRIGRLRELRDRLLARRLRRQRLLCLFLGDRKSTRLNSSHSQISYAVFCLKKKKQTNTQHHHHKLST